LEPLSARGKNTMAMGLIDGSMEISESLVERFLTCTLCGYCREKCPLQVNTVQIIESVRHYFVEKGFFNLNIQNLIQTIKECSNPYGKPAEERKTWSKGIGFKKNSKVLFYGGCVYSYKYPENLKMVMQVLKKADLELNYLNSEACCGYPLLVTGYQAEFENVMKTNVAAFSEHGVEKVIAACPSCVETLKRYKEYTRRAEFEVYHITQQLHELINEGRIQLANKVSMKLAYHDPCHLARYLKIINEPREIIRSLPEVEFKELYHVGLDARCCGGGGGLLTVNPVFSMRIAESRVKEACETGVDAIVTACPTCKSTLEVATKRLKTRLKCADLVELLERAVVKPKC
jgi:glycolate oxidase